MAQKPAICPNCNGPAVREGDEITCEKCDAVFIVKQKEVKVKQIGKLDDLEQRVGRLEGLHGGEPPYKPAPAEEEPDAEEESDFIV